MPVIRRCAAADIPPAFPRLLLIGRDRVASAVYHCDVGSRVERYVAVQITLNGSGMVMDRDGPQPLPVGTGFLFRPGETGVSYGFPPGAREPWEFVYAEIGGEAAEAMAVDVIARRGRVRAIDPAAHAVGDLLRLLSGGGERTLALPAAVSCELACAVLAALVADPGPPGRDRLVGEARAWLSARLGQAVGVAQAAAALGVSREHLTRTWTAVCGEPPGRWLSRERLARGEQLLREGRMGVGMVARGCGFADPGHFAAAFRRRYGVPPATYRRRLVGGDRR